MTPGKVLFSVFGGVTFFVFGVLVGIPIAPALAIATIPFWSVVLVSQPDRRDTHPRMYGDYSPPDPDGAYGPDPRPPRGCADEHEPTYREIHADMMRRKFAARPNARAEIPMPTMSQREITQHANSLLNMALDRVERYSGQIGLDDVARKLNDFAQREAASGRLTQQEIENMNAIVDKAVDICRHVSGHVRNER